MKLLPRIRRHWRDSGVASRGGLSLPSRFGTRGPARMEPLPVFGVSFGTTLGSTFGSFTLV